MPRFKIVTATGVVLVALTAGCGGSDSSSDNSPSTPASAGSSASAGTSPSTSTASGMPFTSAEWGFSIEFPKEPKQAPLNQTVQGTTISGRIFDGSSGNDGVAVSVVKLPAGKPFDVDAGLQGAVSGGAKTAGGTVVEQHAETFQGRKARAATIRVASQNVDYYMEAVFDKGRLYNIIGAPKAQFDAAKASFRFR